MITEDEIAALPTDDNEMAFVQFEKILRSRLNENLAHADQFSAEAYRQEYVNKTCAAAKAYAIDELKMWKSPALNEENYYAISQQFLADVDHCTIQIQIRNAKKVPKYSVRLDSISREKIHHYINNIREIINNSELNIEKRDNLLEKLNDFATAIDKTRTTFQTGMALLIAVCDGIGQGFTKLEPARKWVDSIAALMGRAKDVEETTTRLLAPPVKRLAPPQSVLSPSETFTPDDEIPF